MNKQLQEVIDYAIRQAEESHVSILEDTTSCGDDSADYYEDQLHSLKDLKKAYVVDDLAMIEMLNIITYKYYAAVYRRLQRKPTFSEYIVECQLHVGLLSLSAEAWQGGYEFIADLFNDNEMNGTPCD